MRLRSPTPRRIPDVDAVLETLVASHPDLAPTRDAALAVLLALGAEAVRVELEREAVCRASAVPVRRAA